MATSGRERRPSSSAPISDLQGPVGPGFSRPKHKRTFTGFGAGDIKSVEGTLKSIPPCFLRLVELLSSLECCYRHEGGVADNRIPQLRSQNLNEQHGKSSRPNPL